ncbi:heparan-alpha-glucosaminide N-acetyltransferase-like [Salvia divinorum]|uniref:Heparan-alpha-glucosaminide N-acetyltransferase-like n=1 Tax=Salvia divinorum TaxID=28513 RepID=A0ABD1IHR2_SALDI
MGDDKLIRDDGNEGTFDLQVKNCVMCIESISYGGDAESAYLKSNTPSPRLWAPIFWTDRKPRGRAEIILWD